MLLEDSDENNQEICVSYAIECIQRKNYENAKIFVNRVLVDVEVSFVYVVGMTKSRKLPSLNVKEVSG